jgi:segregation and condensation protein A
MEEQRMKMIRRGNLHRELIQIGEESGEGTEIQSISLFKLMKTFEKVMLRLEQRNNQPRHTVVQYNYTIEDSRQQMIDLVSRNKTVPFESIIETCENRIHAIFLFLSVLELVQQGYMNILIGEGRNNFILEYNSDASVKLEA